MMTVYMVFAGISCVISIVALQVSLSIYDEKLYEKSQQELDFFTQEVNENLKEIENLSYSIATNTDVQEQLSALAEVPYLSGKYSYQMYRLRSLILNELNAHPVVKNVMYTDGKQVEFKVGIDYGSVEDDVYKNMLKEFKEVRGGYISYPPTEDYPYLLSGRDILKIKDSSLDYLGSLILTSDVGDMLAKKSGDLEAAHSTLFAYSQNGFIYKENEQNIPELPPMKETKGYRIVQYQGRKSFLCYQKSETTGWMYVNLFPYSERGYNKKHKIPRRLGNMSKVQVLLKEKGLEVLIT